MDSRAKGLELRGIGVRFGSRDALRGVDMSIGDGEICALLGPSGSGKTTLLRVVAGLEQPTSGEVLLDGRDLAGVPAHQRGIGLMFQDFALFPHRDVGGNVAFGLRMQGQPRDAIERRVAEVLALVGLPGTQRRAISTLSGGEQQRVALARALAPKPAILMLDEPMGSLDRELRERLPLELRALFQSLGVTVVYVTHDQEEALAVADRTIVLRDGRVEADAASEALWLNPPTAFVARFLGYRNVAPAAWRNGRLVSPWGTLPVPGQERNPAPADGPVTAVLRPNAAALTADGELAATVTSRRFRGDHVVLVLDIAGAPLEIQARDAHIPRVGDAVSVSIDPRGVLVLPPEIGAPADILVP